ncbi:MAG TPA: hypothetical protein VHE61_13150 [Opitutaceae bacterium]|nr:hypothetical protein [Opitutaceae bacterium]
MPSPKSDDPLSATLASWRVAPPRDPNFRTEVWHRLEAARRPASWTRFVRVHPAFVTGALAAAVLLGALSGRVEAQQRAAADRMTIAANYVHALDARWMRQR